MGSQEQADSTTFHTGQSCSLPIITILIGDTPFQALLDSGASLSLCNANATNRMSPRSIEHIHTNPNIKISSVSGDEIKITSSIKINFLIGSKHLKHPVLITEAPFSND